MNTLTPSEAYTLLGLFGLSMVSLVWWLNSSERRLSGFLAADRSLGVFRGAMSIAVSWIWAPAIFICSLQAYTKGLPGIFWFTLPNILCFFAFAPFAIRLRKEIPEGYTLSQFIDKRFDRDPVTHIAFLIVFFGYQLGAIVINALAGGTLLHALSGIDFTIAVVSMSAIALSYSLISGLKASVVTDVVQMSVVLLIGFILVPWCLSLEGGITYLREGLSGVDSEFGDLFHPGVAFAMGIPMTLSLLAGPFSDQMFAQRAFAVKRDSVLKTFVVGGMLFGLVPIALSLLGFIGAGMVKAGVLTVPDPQLVGPAVISELLPHSALWAFCFMAFAGLCSTMDSAFCAVSGLGGVDVFKRYISPTASDSETLRASRFAMILLAFIGTGLALMQPKLLWVFLIYGALAASAMFPLILCLFWSSTTAKGAAYGVICSLVLGTPLSFYANIHENTDLIVISAILSAGLGLLVCVAVSLLQRVKLEGVSFSPALEG